MKIFKRRITKGITALMLSAMLITPVMAKTITRNVTYPYNPSTGTSKPYNSPATFIVPNFVQEKTLMVGGYPFEPGAPGEEGETYKTNVIIAKSSPDGQVFKMVLDAKAFPNVHSVEIAGPDTFFHEDAGVYSTRRINLWGIENFSTNGSQKELVITNEFFGGIPGFKEPLVNFYLTLLDQNGNEIYDVDSFNMILLNEKGSETIKSLTQGIGIEINGKKITSNVSPILDKGSTFVPLRVVSENLGALVDFDKKSKEITLSKGKQVIKLKAGSKKATINGVSTQLPGATRSVDGTTFVPIRTIAQAFNSDVHWDANNYKVVITDK